MSQTLSRCIVSPGECSCCLEPLASDLCSPPCGHVVHKSWCVGCNLANILLSREALALTCTIFFRFHSLDRCDRKCPQCRRPFAPQQVCSLFFDLTAVPVSEVLWLGPNGARIRVLEVLYHHLQLRICSQWQGRVFPLTQYFCIWLNRCELLFVGWCARVRI
jgi:hypothetical protein